MTAAFVLAINMFVAGIFAVAFSVVAATFRESRGARWLALGYATGIVDVLLEFILRWQSDPLLVGAAIFLVYLLAIGFCVVGVALHYRVAPPKIAIWAIIGLAILGVPLVFSLPYGTPLRLFLYQLPYFAMQGLGAIVVLRSRRRQALDILLIGLQTLAAIFYLVKPAIAALVGSAASPQAYMGSTYAAISQSMGAVTLIALALVMLLVMMRDMSAEMLVRSHTDALSGVLNRRGFEDRAERVLALALAPGGGEPATLVTADLDRFKQINDEHGHAAGDEVIVRFARLLGEAAPNTAVVGRLGGEEFAVLLPRADLTAGRIYAETVRIAFSELAAAGPGLHGAISASFGVAQLMPGDALHELAARADAALYRAKAGGRNRVAVALNELPETIDPTQHHRVAI